MKKRNGIRIASVAHTILWIAVFVISIIGRLAYKDPEMEPLELFLTKGVYNAFIIIAAAGILNSALLLFSLRSIAVTAITKSKGLEKMAMVFSVLSNILFYLSAVLIFYINTDVIIIVPVMWVLCAFCSCVILIVLRGKKE